MQKRQILERTRGLLQDAGLDAYFTTVADPHLSEYIAPHFETVKFLTGFTGTNAVVIVTAKETLLWTDSRYWEQARLELVDSGCRLMRWGEEGTPSPLEWLKETDGQSPLHLGADFTVFSASLLTKVKDAVCEVRDVGEDFLDALWEDRPAQRFAPFFEVRIGDPVAVKLARVQARLDELARKDGLVPEECLLLSLRLDDVAWLTNLRGSDIAYNPVFYSAILIGKTTRRIYLRQEVLTQSQRDGLLAAGFAVKDYEAIWQDAKECAEKGATVYADFDETNARLLSLPEASVRNVRWPIALMKAVKTKDEIEGMRRALSLDAEAQKVAVTAIRARIAAGETLTESDCARILHEAHATQPEFITESFATSAATGPNAALPHYEPVPGKDLPLTPPCLLLIDSGAHYTCGTTDTTRVYVIGKLEDFDQEELLAVRKDYTAVYEGLKALTEASFEKGTSGAEIDHLAHEPIRRLGIDYGHGTGHGVGFILNVHEAPPTISSNRRRSASVPLEPGMVHSIEPGIYREGLRGIRIENMVAVVEKPDGKLGFETLTTWPIDKELLLS